MTSKTAYFGNLVLPVWHHVVKFNPGFSLPFGPSEARTCRTGQKGLFWVLPGKFETGSGLPIPLLEFGDLSKNANDPFWPILDPFPGRLGLAPQDPV